MPVIRHKDIPERERRPGHRVQNLVGPDQGATGLTVTISKLDPGAMVPLHTHRIEEAIVVQAGEGVFHLGGETVTVGAEATVLVPAETVHGFHNAGPAVLTVLAAFPVTDPLTERWTTYLEGQPPPGYHPAPSPSP